MVLNDQDEVSDADLVLIIESLTRLEQLDPDGPLGVMAASMLDSVEGE